MARHDNAMVLHEEIIMHKQKNTKNETYSECTINISNKKKVTKEKKNIVSHLVVQSWFVHEKYRSSLLTYF